jgi:MFS family permease
VTDDPESWPDGYPHRWRALAVLCSALSIVVIDNTILAVAIPSIEKGLHTDETGLQWIGSSYGLVLAGLLLPLAVIGDRRGRKGLMMLGLVIFGVSSGVAAFSTSAAMLAVARGAMGVGGACTMPSTLSILGNIFPAHERGRAISWWSAVAGVASAAGPIAGGLLLAHFWWGSVFLVNVPIAVVVLFATAMWVPRSHDSSSPPVDRGSALLWWGALSGAILAIVEGPQQGWASPVVLTAGVLAVVLFVAFLKREDRSDAPLIEAQTRADPRLRWGAATVSALFFGVMGTQFVVTQWLQGPLGKSALEAGLYFVPAAVASVLTAFANPRLGHRLGHPAVAALGLLLLAAGGAVAVIGVVTENMPVVVVAALLVGSGIGTAAVSGVELIMSSARPERAGSASGVNETLVEASGALGIAVLGSVLVESGSYAWPLPFVTVVALVVAAGITHRLVRRASRRSRDVPTA